MNSQAQLVPMSWSDLVVGSECGGSDGTSGLAGNPVVGAFFDLLVDRGGSAIFEETVEMIGLRHILDARAASPQAVRNCSPPTIKLNATAAKCANTPLRPATLPAASRPSKKKAWAHFAKSGSRPIQGVIRVAERPPHNGLWLLDSVPDPHFMQFGYTNPNDTEGIMDLICAGSQIILFVTGRGSVIGSAVSPLIKVTGNSITYNRMRDDMDFNAGRILSGEITSAVRCS